MSYDTWSCDFNSTKYSSPTSRTRLPMVVRWGMSWSINSGRSINISFWSWRDSMTLRDYKTSSVSLRCYVFGLSISPTIRRLIRTACSLSRSQSSHKALTFISVLLHRDLPYLCTMWSNPSTSYPRTITLRPLYDIIYYKYDSPW